MFSVLYYFHLYQLSPSVYLVSTAITPTITVNLTPTPSKTKIKTIPTPTDDPTPWGVARQTGEHTWTMKIAQDPVMATLSEILIALNTYRQHYGSQVLTSDPKLTAYVQSRVDYFTEIKNIDSHVGFNNFLNNEDGFNKLGFTYPGENISYGYRLMEFI